MNDQSDISARPLLLGGMHRSGTSLTASLFASAGLTIGPELLGPAPSNPLGHFEDVGFYAFHRRALVAQGICSEGYTATFRGVVPAALEPEARDLLAVRMRPGVAWGWKEPRTTLFLDFWQERIPEARHVFVFRRPWEVVDSLFRRGDDTFAINPAFALDVWTHYNRLILDFVDRQPDRCLVFEISQVIADPHAVIAAVRSRFDVPLSAPDHCYVDALFGRDDSHTRSTLVRSVAPEAWRTYQELCDLARSEIETRSSERSLGECAVLEWARASRATTHARNVEVQAREAVSRVQAEVDSRIQAEIEPRVCAEVDERLRAAAAERRARRSPAAAVGRATRKLLARVAAAERRLFHQEHRDASDAAHVLPFPQADALRGAKRAA